MPRRSRVMFLVAPAACLAASSLVVSAIVLRRESITGECLLILLLALGYARTALSACGSVLGLLPRRCSTDFRLSRTAEGRTALLMPIYHEQPEMVAAAVTAVAAELTPDDRVEIFILSDSQDPRAVEREARVFPPHAVAPSGVVVHYRQRSPNTGRKAGNIAEFCHGAGHRFDQAVVLDADSTMTGDAIRALVGVLNASPGVGLVQSVSYPIGAGTLFGRMQQFSARLATPLGVAGQDFWQDRRGTYWGHNAILRLAPFRSHAGLPTLPGKPPMGGELLCHDTIEAAFLLRAGWEVTLAPDIGGSYETTPSNLVDHLARERRWCQGNLQHLRVAGETGLLPESRLHILTGILHYLAAPAALGLSALLFLDRRAASEVPLALVSVLIGLGVFLLFGPKLLGLARAMVLPGAARGFGGRGRLLASALLEQIASMLLAPVLTVSIAGFVLATAAGRVVVWDAPARGDRRVGWREAWWRFGTHTAIGVSVGLFACITRPAALVWLSPFLIGLCGAVPIAVWSSSVRLGQLARQVGLFQTEGEVRPGSQRLAKERRSSGRGLAEAAE